MTSITKRILLALICVTAVVFISGVIFALAPRPTFAEGGELGEKFAMAHETAFGEEYGEGTAIGADYFTDGYTLSDGSYYPTADIGISQTIRINGNAELSLNGNSLTGTGEDYEETETSAPDRQAGHKYLVVLTVVFSVLLAVNTGLIISQLMIRKMGGAE